MDCESHHELGAPRRCGTDYDSRIAPDTGWGYPILKLKELILPPVLYHMRW